MRVKVFPYVNLGSVRKPSGIPFVAFTMLQTLFKITVSDISLNTKRNLKDIVYIALSTLCVVVVRQMKLLHCLPSRWPVEISEGERRLSCHICKGIIHVTNTPQPGDAAKRYGHVYTWLGNPVWYVKNLRSICYEQQTNTICENW